MKIRNPLCIFDLETTGLDVAKDRIIQISIVKLYPNGKKEIKTRLVNPGIDIPEEATKTHNITNDMVISEPKFCEIADSFYDFLHGCDIGGYNCIDYDIPLLAEEFLRCGIEWKIPAHVIDCCRIFKNFEKRTLEAAYKFYCNGDISELHAHNAENDALTTSLVMHGQSVKYSLDFDNLVESSKYENELRRIDPSGHFVKDNENNIIFGFGKHKNRLAHIEVGYLNWMLNSDFPLTTKKVICEILGYNFKMRVLI